jgi:AAA domain
MNDLAGAIKVTSPVKTLFMGESGSGKTCALHSLLQAGYKVAVLDLDNGIEALRSLCSEETASKLTYLTLTEPMRFAAGRIVPAKATVWTRAMTTLNDWKNSDPAIGTICALGPVSKWGPDRVLVIDTISTLSQAALNFHLAMNGALGGVRSANEARRDIGAAQELIRTLLQYLFDISLRCNVIASSHITYVKQEGSGQLTPGENAPTQGFPSAIGRALSPEMPRYFNSVLLCRTAGANQRQICTTTQGNINLKTTAPRLLKPTYDQAIGLAEIFKTLQGPLT